MGLQMKFVNEELAGLEVGRQGTILGHGLLLCIYDPLKTNEMDIAFTTTFPYLISKTLVWMASTDDTLGSDTIWTSEEQRK
jgi:hypothetical protein